MIETDNHTIWKGDVVAIQGAARLTAPLLDVFSQPGTSAAPSLAGSAPRLGAIERMEAEGPVNYATPQQTARGDHATYLAADNTMVITGKVTVVQGEDVKHGDRLVIDTRTGRSTLTASPEPSAEGPPPSVSPPAPSLKAAARKPAQPEPDVFAVLNRTLVAARNDCQAELQSGRLKSYAALATCDNAAMTQAFHDAHLPTLQAVLQYERATLEIAGRVDRRRLSLSDARIEVAVAAREMNRHLGDGFENPWVSHIPEPPAQSWNTIPPYHP